MTILRLEGLARQIQGQQLFQDVDLSIEDGDRLGVIGLNGSGKSTLLRTIAGLLEPDSGSVWVADGYRVGYLSQEPELPAEQTVLQVVYLGHSEVLAIWDEYQEACAASDLSRMSRLQAELEHHDFFHLQTRAEVVVQHLGLASQAHSRMATLSGGQRRRVALAQLLVQQPDVLLLDEPTNHLDTDSIDWLEGYLRSYSGAVLMVTHDRYFLDRITTRTLEIEGGRVTAYLGNYARYLEKKAELQEQAEATAAKRANLWRRELEWLRRGPRARATKQKARIERAEALRPGEQEQKTDLSIELGTARLGKKVLEARGLSKAFGDRSLLRGFDFTLEPGARIGIVGPNGSGKTTLLELLSGRLEPDSGTVEIGSTVKLGYFDQESRALNPEQKVLDSLRDVAESIPLKDGSVITASQMLERFLFSGRLQHTLVGKLSGGERRRLYLLQVLMGNPNVLFLDEPSNDLDIPTLSCLEDYLDSFPGSLLVSSHDRYLLDRTVEELLAFEGGPVPRRFTGSYSDYARQRPAVTPRSSSGPASTRPSATPAPTPAPARARKLSFKEKRELESLESGIARAEARQAELEQTLTEQATNYSAVRQAHEELERLKVQLEADMERWAELAELAD